MTDIPDIQLDSRNDPALFGNQFFDSFKLKWIVQFTLEGPLSQPPKVKATSNTPVGFLVEYQGYNGQATSNPDHVRHFYLMSFDLVNVPQVKDYVFDDHQVTLAFEDGENPQKIRFVVEVGRDIPKNLMLDRSGQAVVRKKSLPEDSKLPFYGNETLTVDSNGSWDADKVTYRWFKYSSPKEFGTDADKYNPARNGNEKDFIPDGPGKYRLCVMEDNTRHEFFFDVVLKPESPPEKAITSNVPVAVDIFENHPANKPVTDLAGPGTFQLTAGMADNRFFRIDSDTGMIWFVPGPAGDHPLLDHEKPGDRGGDNTYELRIVRSHEGRDLTFTVEITVQDLVGERVFDQGTSRFSNALQRSERSSLDPDALAKLGVIEKLLLQQFGPEGGGRPISKSATDDPLIITWSIYNAESILRSQYAFKPVTIQLGDAERQATLRSLLNPFTDKAELDAFRGQVRKALDEFEAAANIKFVEVADNHHSAGDLRLFKADQFARSAQSISAFQADDHVFLPSQPGNQNPNSQHITILHEIAHFLGLGHPFKDEDKNDPYYLSEATVMSYATFPFESNLTEADIEALRFIFGAPAIK